MRFSFNIGKRFVGLTQEEKRVLERLKRREITAEQAELELGGHVHGAATGGSHEPQAPHEDPADGAPPDETAEERTARELVERIAREVDAERAR
jgi:hypothetical protein